MKQSSNGKSKVRDMVFTALAAALICVCAPISFKVGAVPISLATLAVYIVAASLGFVRGTVATLVYIAIGAVGLPVFAGFNGGFHVLAGVTGGYIWGYVVCAAIVGIASDKIRHKAGLWLGMVLGTAACYKLGTAWYMLQTHVGLGAAMASCVLPFLPVDAVKIVIAALVSPKIRELALREKSKKSDADDSL